MPANLPPDYHKAEERFRSARTVADKIAALEEMLRIMPKHKGTDGLQADVKARIAKLRRQPEKKAARASFSRMIPREGAGQAALVGAPNAGKSSLLAALTNATPAIGEYAFTTRDATPGMMPYEDIAFQLIDLPALSLEHVEPWVFDLIKAADLLWIVLNGESALEDFDETLEVLSSRKIPIRPAGTPPVPDEEREWLQKEALLVVTRLDRPEVPDAIEAFSDLLEVPWPIIGVSTTAGSGLDELRQKTFEALEVVRIYTKQPGKPADRSTPFALRRGATVADLATRIHKDLLANMRFARVWGTSAFDGQTVHRDHVLEEGDVVEIHA
jgi:uncharacterized protein